MTYRYFVSGMRIYDSSSVWEPFNDEYELPEPITSMLQINGIQRDLSHPFYRIVITNFIRLHTEED